MKTVLVVTQPFADYQKGDQIGDADAMKAALETNEAHVVQTPAPADEPAEATAAPAKTKADK